MHGAATNDESVPRADLEIVGVELLRFCSLLLFLADVDSFGIFNLYPKKLVGRRGWLSSQPWAKCMLFSGFGGDDGLLLLAHALSGVHAKKEKLKATT